MDPLAEGEVALDAAAHVEAVGVLELALVAVGRAPEQEELRALAQRLAVHHGVRVSRRGSACAGDS